jgi:Rha family phage regulatory protein
MNALTALNTNATLTMSSREIAELTGKRHDNVVRDTRKMLEELGANHLNFEGVYIDSKGESRTCFNLPKDLTITLVSGYNVQMRYAITKRWMELEAQQAPSLPTTFAEALRLAAELEEQKEALEAENTKLTHANTVLLPKAEGYDAVVSNEGFYTATQAAQMLGCNSAVVLNRILKTLGWKSKRDADAPTKKAIKAGWLAVRMRQRSDSFRSFPQVFVTPKGIDELRRILGSWEAA